MKELDPYSPHANWVKPQFKRKQDMPTGDPPMYHQLVMPQNYWQICPICQGTGHSTSVHSTTVNTICDVCKGKKIISTLTGLPPL